ncbi:MAG TPA: glycosyltransferase [Patescibacteria group bacterium]|nr:glycosyltransferase [Patescibacteria group bacterium]
MTPGAAPARALPEAQPGRPIRILLFVNGFGMGGTERHVVNLVRALDRTRFDLHLACFKRWGQLLGEVENRGVPIHEYPIDSLHNHRTVRQQWRFARDLRRHGIQVVHTHNFYANVFAVPAARLARVPVVLASIRDTGVYQTPMQKNVQKMACRLAHRVVVNADAIRNWLVGDGYRRDRIVVIRNGIDLSGFRRPRDARDVRHELGVPADAPLVVMISRLHELKGLDDFLDAAAILLERRPDLHFLVVGARFKTHSGEPVRDDAYQRVLERQARRLGIADRVRFTGFRLDVPALLAASSVSVLPSLSEGLSNTVLESMAAGIPVVTTGVGGTPEAVTDGETGLLVVPRDSPALARAIGRVLDDPDLARRLGQNARGRIERQFSLEVMARATEDLYRNLVPRDRHAGKEATRHV